MFELPTKTGVIRVIEKFCSRSGMSVTEFGRQACADPALMIKLRQKKYNPALDRLWQIRKFIQRRSRSKRVMEDLL